MWLIRQGADGGGAGARDRVADGLSCCSARAKHGRCSAAWHAAFPHGRGNPPGGLGEWDALPEPGGTQLVGRRREHVDFGNPWNVRGSRILVGIPRNPTESVGESMVSHSARIGFLLPPHGRRSRLRRVRCTRAVFFERIAEFSRDRAPSRAPPSWNWDSVQRDTRCRCTDIMLDR